MAVLRWGTKCRDNSLLTAPIATSIEGSGTASPVVSQKSLHLVGALRRIARKPTLDAGEHREIVMAKLIEFYTPKKFCNPCCGFLIRNGEEVSSSACRRDRAGNDRERGGVGMSLILTLAAVGVAALFVLVVVSKKRAAERRMEQHSITADELHSLLTSNRKLLLFDLRQPLDLLAHTDIIPGAQRIPPKEVLERPSLIPNEEDAVIYCTCPGEKTSRAVLHQALALHFERIKFLKGGLDAWKAKGYPVEPYTEVFHLYSPSA